MKTQIVENTIEEYHARDGYISKSTLCDILDTPYTYKYYQDNPKPEKDHLNVGNAVHTLALEPHLFKDKFFILPEGQRRDKRMQTYKDLLTEAGDRSILTHDDAQEIKIMAKSLAMDTASVMLLMGPGKIETSIYFEYNGFKLKCRPDKMRDNDLIVDVKTAKDVSLRGFNRSALDHCYDVSVALTYEGYKAATGRYPSGYAFVCVQNTAPFMVASYVPDEMFLEYGKYRLDKALDTLKRCQDTDTWPSYSQKIEKLTVPDYLLANMGE